MRRVPLAACSQHRSVLSDFLNQPANYSPKQRHRHVPHITGPARHQVLHACCCRQTRSYPRRHGAPRRSHHGHASPQHVHGGAAHTETAPAAQTAMQPASLFTTAASSTNSCTRTPHECQAQTTATLISIVINPGARTATRAHGEIRIWCCSTPLPPLPASQASASRALVI